MEKSLRHTVLTMILLLVAAVPGPGQTPDPAPAPEGFERQYLRPEGYRSGEVILYDWPGLTRLVRWSSRLEASLSEADATLSAELLSEFRARVDSLAAVQIPAFLAAKADSARAAMVAIDSILDRAEASLGALPPAPTPTGGEALNTPGRQRTLVTGNTAVTVPAGVHVGDADSLPTAEVAEGGENFLDLVALALTELDRLVHMTRTVSEGGAKERPSDEAPNPPLDRAPDRPGP